MGSVGFAIVWLVCGICCGACIVIMIWKEYSSTFKDHTQEEYKALWNKMCTILTNSPFGKGKYKTVSVKGKTFNIRAEFSKLKVCERVQWINLLIDETVVATVVQTKPAICHPYYDFEIQKSFIKDEILLLIDEASKEVQSRIEVPTKSILETIPKTRQQLIDKYNLKYLKTVTTTSDKEYNYQDSDGDVVVLHDEAKNYRFEITADDGEVISSMIFSDYENEDKFDLRYKQFKKFWRNK